MSTNNPKYLFVGCGDLHLSHDVPVSRGETRSQWYDVQGYYLQELNRVAAGKPILCAGDVLDRWDAPAEFVNFLIGAMPVMCAVAGNHDLPNHQLKDIKRSAYWTLVEAGKLLDLSVGNRRRAFDSGFWAYGVPCGNEELPSRKMCGGLHVAVAHDLVWDGDSKPFPGAPMDKFTSAQVERFRGFDVVLMGDNHSRVAAACPPGLPTILNCGTFIRRKSDEQRHRPCCVKVYPDKSYKFEEFDTSSDVWRDRAEPVAAAPTDGVEELLREIRRVGRAAIDFSHAIENAMRRGCGDEIKEIVRSVMGESRDARR